MTCNRRHKIPWWTVSKAADKCRFTVWCKFKHLTHRRSSLCSVHWAVIPLVSHLVAPKTHYVIVGVPLNHLGFSAITGVVVIHATIFTVSHLWGTLASCGLRDVRIDQLRFRAACRKKRLNQTLSVLSFSLKAKQSKAKMCNGRRHVPLCPASANEKYIVQKYNYNKMLSSVFIWLLFPTPVNSTL